MTIQCKIAAPNLKLINIYRDTILIAKVEIDREANPVLTIFRSPKEVVLTFSELDVIQDNTNELMKLIDNL